MILITGATGNLGGHVVQHLRQHLPLDQFAVLVRNVEKAKPLIDQGIHVLVADFNQSESLSRAFSGISKLLLISTMVMNRLDQHKAVIDAAKQAGVKHIVYTGLAIQDIQTSAVKDLMISHFETENYIQKSGLIYTFLRNTMYAEAIPQIIGEQAISNGLALAGGDGKVPYATRAELGEATANVLIQKGHENQTYSLVGSQAYCFQDIADILTEIKNSKVEYQNLENQTYRENLEKNGLPEFWVYLTQGTVLDIQHHQYDLQSSDLEKLLGRKTAPLKKYLSQVYA